MIDIRQIIRIRTWNLGYRPTKEQLDRMETDYNTLNPLGMGYSEQTVNIIVNQHVTKPRKRLPRLLEILSESLR